VERPGGLGAIGGTPAVRLDRLVTAGIHRIKGGGVGFVPPLLTIDDDVDEVIPISTADAFAMARRAAREDGIWSGPSTGANIAAALILARRLGEDARVATIVDSGSKYLAGELYS
jgi:cysteine synthase